MRANGSRLYHSGLKPIKRSTFCDALENRPHQVFQSAFYKLVDYAQGIACKMKKQFANPLRIIDASIISLCLAQFDWAKYRKAKGAVKLHMNLDGDNLIPCDAILSNGKVHDTAVMEKLTSETGMIYVLDRGYVDYKSLYSIELNGSVFVTRMKRNGAYKRVKENPCAEGGPVLFDVLIMLTGKKTKELYPKEMRIVKYYDEENDRTFEFLTNDLKRPAEEIALIYKKRWEVELFFKWIKQHLKVKSFWGTSENAVYSQIWAALILTVLLWIARVMEGITASPYELLIMMKVALLTKNTLAGLCTNIMPLKPDEECFQPFLEGFKW